MYLFAPVAFAMKVTALHLWSIFTPKSGANAKKREKRMHFGVAQRFAASIAGVKQTSLELSTKASAGLLRRAKGHAALWRGVASQCQGVCRFAARDCLAVSGDMDLWRGMFSERGGGFVPCTARRVFISLSGRCRTSRGMQLCGAGWSRNVGGGSCYVPSAARSFAFGELARIEALAALWRGMVSERGGGSCYVPRAVRSFAFGELVHIEALVFCVRAPRVHSLSGSSAHIEALAFCV